MIAKKSNINPEKEKKVFTTLEKYFSDAGKKELSKEEKDKMIKEIHWIIKSDKKEVKTKTEKKPTTKKWF